jgi:hypothetical protein
MKISFNRTNISEQSDLLIDTLCLKIEKRRLLLTSINSNEIEKKVIKELTTSLEEKTLENDNDKIIILTNGNLILPSSNQESSARQGKQLIEKLIETINDALKKEMIDCCHYISEVEIDGLYGCIEDPDGLSDKKIQLSFFTNDNKPVAVIAYISCSNLEITNDIHVINKSPFEKIREKLEKLYGCPVMILRKSGVEMKFLNSISIEHTINQIVRKQSCRIKTDIQKIQIKNINFNEKITLEKIIIQEKLNEIEYRLENEMDLAVRSKLIKTIDFLKEIYNNVPLQFPITLVDFGNMKIFFASAMVSSRISMMIQNMYKDIDIRIVDCAFDFKDKYILDNEYVLSFDFGKDVSLYLSNNGKEFTRYIIENIQ